jgi:SWI/SNF-related matrix-associated actin-dependent regulator of chromatin subfamily A protein 2/4
LEKNGTAKPVQTVTIQSSMVPSSGATDSEEVIIQPMSVIQLVAEREKRIRSRMSHRMEELGMLPADLPPTLKRRAMIEVKQLRLLDIQRKLRAQVADRMRRTAEVEASADTSAYRKTKRLTTRDAKALPARVVSRPDIDQVKMQKHSEFLNAVLKHSRDFKEFYANRAKKQKRLTKDIVNHYTNEQRRIQQEEERKQRARLQALKENNEEEYLKLLQEAKNSRLATLLKQTDEYLDKVSSMLQLQKDYDEIGQRKKEIEERKAKLKEKKKKEEAGEKGKKDEEEEKKDAQKGSDKVVPTKSQEEIQPMQQDQQEGTIAATLEKNRKYYTMAHSIQETVTEQPTILVGGKLKQYQLVGVQWLVSLYNNKLNGILAGNGYFIIC